MASPQPLHRQCVLLKRKEGMSQDDFTHHWRTTHADIVRELGEHKPAYYSQTTPVDPAAFLAVKGDTERVDYSGIASLDFKDEAACKAATSTPRWTGDLRGDGPNFSIGPSTRFFKAEAYVIIDKGERKSTFRQFIFLRRAERMSSSEFKDYWLHKHAPLIESLGVVKQHVLRYEQVYPLDDALPLGPSIGEHDFDGIAILDYADKAGWEATSQSDEWKSKVGADNKVFVSGAARVFAEGYLVPL